MVMRQILCEAESASVTVLSLHEVLIERGAIKVSDLQEGDVAF